MRKKETAEEDEDAHSHAEKSGDKMRTGNDHSPAQEVVQVNHVE